MATVNEARDILRGLTKTVQKKSKQKFPLEVQGMKCLLSESDLDEYLLTKELQKRPNETSFFKPGHYEHVIEVQGRGPGIYRLLRETDEIILQNKTKDVQVEISRLSPCFALSICDTDKIHRDIRRFVMFARHRHQGKDDVV